MGAFPKQLDQRLVAALVLQDWVTEGMWWCEHDGSGVYNQQVVDILS